MKTDENTECHEMAIQQNIMLTNEEKQMMYGHGLIEKKIISFKYFQPDMNLLVIQHKNQKPFLNVSSRQVQMSEILWQISLWAEGPLEQ